MESSSDTRWMDALQGFALLEEYQKRRGNLQVRIIFHSALSIYRIIHLGEHIQFRSSSSSAWHESNGCGVLQEGIGGGTTGSQI